MAWIAVIPIGALVFAATSVAWAIRQGYVMARDGEADWHSRPMVLWTASAATLANLFLPTAFPTRTEWKTALGYFGLALMAAHPPAVIVAQRLGARQRRPPPSGPATLPDDGQDDATNGW